MQGDEGFSGSGTALDDDGSFSAIPQSPPDFGIDGIASRNLFL